MKLLTLLLPFTFLACASASPQTTTPNPTQERIVTALARSSCDALSRCYSGVFATEYPKGQDQCVTELVDALPLAERVSPGPCTEVELETCIVDSGIVHCGKTAADLKRAPSCAVCETKT